MGKRGRVVIAVLSGGLLLLAAVLAASGSWSEVSQLTRRVAAGWTPPSEGQVRDLRPRELEALAAIAADTNARVVWSSNRSGNHELYELDLGSGEIRALTDHPHVDFGARFSADGKRLVFMRSQRPWVSFRENDAWDVYVMPAEGGEPTLVTSGAYHPTWGPDDESVVFQRSDGFYQIDLASGDERRLQDVATQFPGRAFGDPALHADGRRLAFYVKNVGGMTAEAGRDEASPLTDSQICQTTWVPDSDDLLWVEPEGNGGTRIIRGAADGSRSEVLMDLPGDRSHEYFPLLSDDGRWLVWGAAAEGHEHDRADYEIFLWQVGEPWESAIRLTRYTGNDQWPDIHVEPR